MKTKKGNTYFYNAKLCLTFFTLVTHAERIAGHTRGTITIGHMQGDNTIGIETTRTRTRIATFLIDTSQIVGTIIVGAAFGSAIGRCTNKLGQT